MQILTSIRNYILKKIEPPPLFVYFGDIVPGFGRINTPKKGWDEDKRTKKLSNGTTYIAPDYEEMKGHFVLLNEWPIVIREKINGEIEVTTFSIPLNTPTDFASIPSILHSFVSPLDNSIYSAVLHDYLYRNPAELTPRNISKAKADIIFYYGLKAYGKSIPSALMFYWGVKFFGHSSYIRE